MLTVAEDTLQELAEQHGKPVSTYLYGQEINAETYAICKADLLLKGEGEHAENIIGGPEYSTLSNDAWRTREFDFIEVELDGKLQVVEFEPDSDLRDYEQIPLLEEGGIAAFIEREVLPYVPDACVDESYIRIGYENSFTRYFYKPQELRPLDEIRADIIALEQETEGLLDQILNLGTE